MTMRRRQIIKAGGIGALAAGSAVTTRAEDAEFHWKMAMTAPKQFPGVGTNVQWFVENVRRATNGRVNITLYGVGELVPAFEVFNAVSDGTIELGHGAAYYWKGIVPESEIFTTVPFGLSPLEFTAWYNLGGGREMQTELYKPFGVIPMLGGNSDYQMGGWFNKQINSIDDFKGLKIRIPGIGGEVLSRAGATVITMPGNEIYTSMQSGVIDAADWVGPWNDMAFGLYKVAKYYYGGWHEPSGGVDLLINEKAWNQLPEDVQVQIEMVCEAMNQRMTADYRMHNAIALQTLQDNHNVEVLYFNEGVIRKLAAITKDYMDEYAAKSPFAKKVADAYQTFLKQQIEASKNARHQMDYRLTMLSD